MNSSIRCWVIKVIKYFLWCGCEAYDALSLFPILQKTFFLLFKLRWVESLTRIWWAALYTTKLSSHWLQIRSRNARLHVDYIFLCLCKFNLRLSTSFPRKFIRWSTSFLRKAWMAWNLHRLLVRKALSLNLWLLPWSISHRDWSTIWKVRFQE